MYRRRSILAIPAFGGLALAQTNDTPAAVSIHYPSQDPEMAKEMVGAAHFNVKRVKELLALKPSLAKAAWDWGFGDWEMALGSASHVGNREIAHLLLSHGAQPTIFSAAMLGQLETVKAFITASPGIERTKGPHSITLLSHAKAGGPQAAAVVEYLKTVEGADQAPRLEPLTDVEKTAISGTYSFGKGATEKLDVSVTKGQLSIQRPGGDKHRIHHLGSYAFYPAGAETVRIRFTLAENKKRSLVIHDPDVVLSAFSD